MKKSYQKFLLPIFYASLFLALPTDSLGQLNGNYTLNPSRTATSTNYRDWASVVGDLVSGSRSDGGAAQGSGVSGPVTITVYDTLFDNTAIEITAITGTSYTNTIKFKSAGGDSAKCKLRIASSASNTNDYVLSLNGANYISFQEIGFERTGTNTYCNVVVINNANNNKLIRCFLKGKKMPSSSTLGFQYGPGSIIYYTAKGDSTQLIQNEIMYGYNGIFSVSGSTSVIISANNIDTSGSSGVYMTSQTGLQILGNTFNMGDFGAGKGHYVSYGFRIETSPSLIALNNKVTMSAVNGQVVRAIVIASLTSPSTAPAMVCNNTIINMGGTTECTGFAVYGTYYLNIMYNNVLINNSLTNASAYYHYAAYANSNIRILNNNLVNKGGGYALNVPGTNTGDIDSLDYNNLYSNGNYIGNWNATNYSTFSAWQSGTTRDVYSMNVDPGYTSNTNLHVSNIKLNGKAKLDSRITTDIDGDTRDNASPDIGADEFFPATLDAGVANLDSPLLFCAGKQNVRISFQNYGFDTIKSVQIQWSINGTSQNAYTWTGTLAPGNSAPNVNIGSYTFAANTLYNFKIFTKSPNNKSDQRNVNDTLKIGRYAAMAGNYTIGDTSVANYKSFNQAITAMTSRGICGAITFSVYKGTYNEQLTMVPLPGMGKSNPIKFKNIGNDSSTVIVSLASTTATGSNNAAIQLRGANYLTFQGITFERTGTTTNIGHVIHILNGAHHNTFSNCQMIGLMNGTTQGYNIWSDGSKDDYNTFRNNRIRFGNTNMQYLATTAAHEIGTVIEGNIFENSLNNSALIQFNDSITVKGNVFMNVNNHLIGNYDIQLFDCDNAINVNGNYFNSTNLDTSLWINACNATAANNGIIANNSLTKNYGKGIVLDGVDYQKVVFNSIYFKSNLPDNMSIVTTAATSSNIILKNNNIVMFGGEVFHITSASHISSSDYNNLHTKGSNFAFWGAAINNLPNLIATSGMDAKSVNLDPMFISAKLHIKNYLLKGKGQPIAGVTTDFDGDTRNGTKPDIGADEFTLTPNDAGIIAIIKPIAGTCAGTLDVSAVIKNFGKDTLTSSIITWSINNVLQTSYSWTGKLITNATDTVTIGSYNFSTIFNPKIMAKANVPNGQSDGITFNDSIIITRALKALPNANAGADLTICYGDSTLIGLPAVTGMSYQWTTISNNVIGNTAEIIVKPTAKTKYIVEVTNTAFGCVKRDTVEIGINTKPTANAGKDKSICPGNMVQLGDTAQSGFTYSWSSMPSGFTSTMANPTDAPTFTTTYIIEKTVSGSGCTDADSVTISVANVPLPKITGKGIVCNNEKQTYSTQNNSGNTYKWIITGGTLLSGQGTNSVNVKWTTAGIGILNVIETNSSTCFDTVPYYTTVNPNPTADFNVIGTCLNSLSTFKNLSINGQNYAWTFGDGTSSILKEPSHTYPEAISYNVTLIVKNSFGCPDTLTKLLPIDPLPIANFTYLKKPSNTLDFTNSSSVSSGTIVSWNWNFGDGDTSTQKDPSHAYPSSANYTLTLCVKSAAGCETCTTRVVGTIGISKPVMSSSIHVYPNPGSGIYTIESSRLMQTVILFNSVGQTIQTQEPWSNSHNLNISDQPKGIYLAKIYFGNQVQIVRILKE